MYILFWSDLLHLRNSESHAQAPPPQRRPLGPVVGLAAQGKNRLRWPQSSDTWLDEPAGEPFLHSSPWWTPPQVPLTRWHEARAALSISHCYVEVWVFVKISTILELLETPIRTPRLREDHCSLKSCLFVFGSPVKSYWATSLVWFRGEPALVWSVGSSSLLTDVDVDVAVEENNFNVGSLVITLLSLFPKVRLKVRLLEKSKHWFQFKFFFMHN